MPTGNVHWKLCRDLGIDCQLNTGRCPLDEKRWHRTHWKILDEEWKAAQDSNFKDGIGCYVERVLMRMEPKFNDFQSEFESSQNRDILKKCWTAHLIADAVTNYKWAEIEADFEKYFRRSF